MLAEQRRRAAGRGVAVGEAKWQVGQSYLSQQGVLLLDDHATRQRLRIGQHLVDGLHRRCGDAGGVKRLAAGLDRSLLHGPRTRLGQYVRSVRITTRLVVKTGVGRIRLAPYQAGEPQPGVVNLRGDHQIAVARREHPIHGALGQVVPGLHRQLGAAAHQVALGRIVVHRHHAVVEREINVPAAAAADPAEQRRADRRHAVHAGVHVGDGHSKQRRRLARDPNQRHRAALGLGNQAESRSRRVRAGVSVSRHRAIHQPRVAPGQLLVAQAQFIEGAGAVVLDEDVGALAQLVEQLQATRVLQIDAQPLFAHVLLHEVAALARDDGRARAASVASNRPLDLDDFGAHRAQAARHMRPSQKVAVIDDADSRERQRSHLRGHCLRRITLAVHRGLSNHHCVFALVQHLRVPVVQF